MVTDSQATHVMALVRERHNAVRKSFDELLNAFAKGDQQQVISANETLRTALHQLEAVVAAGHWPNWLKDMVLNADRYVTRHNNGLATWRAHLNSVLNNADALSSEDWSFSDEKDILFDADAIVAKARSDHRIDLLYEHVIVCLQQLLDSGEIDSLRASTDLGRLVSTLQKAKGASFSSQVFNWRFARRLIPNIMAAYVKRNSVTGPLLEAFEQTATELDVSLEKAKDQIGADILAAAAGVLRTDAALAITQDSTLFLEHHSGSSEAEAVEFRGHT